MSGYNDNLLPDPCLRMDTHFGDEYESVEFGDGTGYVKAAPMLARLGALHVELDELRDALAKLRELAAGVGYLLFSLDVDYCVACPRDSINHPCPVHTVKGGECLYKTDLRELGVEVSDDWHH